MPEAVTEFASDYGRWNCKNSQTRPVYGSPCATFQQVEQHRASPVLVHQSELARSTAAESRSYRQSDREHENKAGTQGASQVRHQPISLWSQGDRRGTVGGLAQTGKVSRRMELQHPSQQCTVMEHLFWHSS